LTQPQVVTPPAGGSNNHCGGGPACGQGGRQGRGGKGKGRGGGTHVVFDESLQYYDPPNFEEFQDYMAMLVDDASTSGIVEIPAYPTRESLDHELDEYNAERPMAPFSEEACKAMWADESMGPSKPMSKKPLCPVCRSLNPNLQKLTRPSYSPIQKLLFLRVIGKR